MTTATTLAVILAFCLGAAVIISMRHYYGAKHIQQKYNAVSHELGYAVKKIFDGNYGEVNIYHRCVFEAVYGK